VSGNPTYQALDTWAEGLKRSFSSGLEERCCGRTLIAAWRLSRVSRAVDLTHPARAQRRDDLIRTEFGAKGKCHCVRALYRFKSQEE
jgi:hypothetical protein